MDDSHLPKKIEPNIHQKLYFVDAKVLMFKKYNPVEETQITDKNNCQNSLRTVVLFGKHKALKKSSNGYSNLGNL